MARPLEGADIYRIKPNGSGKASNLTGQQTGSFRPPPGGVEDTKGLDWK
jgi:hypothetical protein